MKTPAIEVHSNTLTHPEFWVAFFHRHPGTPRYRRDVNSPKRYFIDPYFGISMTAQQQAAMQGQNNFPVGPTMHDLMGAWTTTTIKTPLSPK